MEKDLDKHLHKSHLSKYWILYLLILVESFMIVLYSIFVQYGTIGGARFSRNYNQDTQDHITNTYPAFQDINVMIFIGFGFVMAYFKNYTWTAIAISFALAAWTIQMALLTNGWWYAIFSGDWTHKISLNMYGLIDAEYTTGAVLVAVGAVLGKLSLTQYVVMATMIALSQTLINNLTFEIFKASDIGGGMYVFLYGAVFGLSVAITAKKQNMVHPRNLISSRNSNIIAFIGTLFLWVYWPSWNSAWSYGNAQQRAIINTILSLTGSCVMSFLFSPFMSNGKFNIKHILYVSISGGVIISSIADMIILPWASFFIGCCAGTIAIFGLHYVTPRMNKTIFQDSCGVLFLHGIPGFLSGIISAILAGIADYSDFGEAMYAVFPLYKDNERSRGNQAGYQLCTIAVVLILAIITGLVTGVLLNFSCFDGVESLFDDREFFNNLPEGSADDYDDGKKYEHHYHKENSELQHFKEKETVKPQEEEVKPQLEEVKPQEEEVKPQEIELKPISVPFSEVKHVNKPAEIKHIEIQIEAMD